MQLHKEVLVDVSDIFYFFGSGRGKGESEAPGRGGAIFIEFRRKGGGFSRRGVGPRGGEGVCGELGNFGEGGAKYFFLGLKCAPRSRLHHALENTTLLGRVENSGGTKHTIRPRPL